MKTWHLLANMSDKETLVSLEALKAQTLSRDAATSCLDKGTLKFIHSYGLHFRSRGVSEFIKTLDIIDTWYSTIVRDEFTELCAKFVSPSDNWGVGPEDRVMDEPKEIEAFADVRRADAGGREDNYLPAGSMLYKHVIKLNGGGGTNRGTLVARSSANCLKVMYLFLYYVVHGKTLPVTVRQKPAFWAILVADGRLKLVQNVLESKLEDYFDNSLSPLLLALAVVNARVRIIVMLSHILGGELGGQAERRAAGPARRHGRRG